MKYKTLAVLAAAGVLGISGAAFAGVNVNVNIDGLTKLAAKTQSRPQLPPKMENMPPMSRDNTMPPPPGAHSPDKRPPELRDKKMPPMSRDNRMPPPPGAHSPDKRPQELRK